MNRKYIVPMGIAIVVSLVFAYTNYFGPKTVLQTNPDPNCRQGNVLDGVDRQMRFLVLSTCEKDVGIVHDVKGEKGDDGDYEFDLEVEDPYKKLMNTDNTKQVNGMLVIEIMPKDQNDPSTQFQKMVTK